MIIPLKYVMSDLKKYINNRTTPLNITIFIYL
jgi:hypothetical protein